MEQGHHNEHRHFMHLPRAPLQVHLPHLHVPHNPFGHHHNDGEFEYAFENPDLDDDVSDTESEMTDETMSQASGAVGSKGLASKVKGGVKGAGAATFNAARNRRVCERIFMAALAVCILWFTSYALSRALVRYMIVTPSWDEVVGANEQAYNVSLVENSRYVTCVNELADACADDFNNKLEIEVERTDAQKLNNSNWIDWINTNETVASALLNETLIIIKELAETQASFYDEYQRDNGTDAPECKFVQGLVAGDKAAISALTSALDFQDTAEKAVLTREQQIYAREQYDRDYIAAKSVWFRQRGEELKQAARDPQTTFQNLNNTFAGFVGCFAPGGTGCSQTNAFEAIKSAYDETFSRFGAMKDSAVEFRVEVRAQLQQFRSLIESLDGSVLAVFAEDLGSFQIPGTSESNEPTTLGAALSDLQARAIVGVKDPNSLFAGSGDKLNAFYNTLGLEQLRSEENAAKLAQTADSFDAGWNDDYDPPNVTANVTVTDFMRVSDAFAPSLTNKLSALSRSGDDETTGSSVKNTTAGSLNTTASDLLTRVANHSTWDFYKYSDEIVNEVSSGLADLSNLALWFDIAFRILRTVFIIRKYILLSAISTPPGDARIKAAVGNGWGPKQTPIQKIAAILTNPIVIALLLTGTVVTLLYLTWFAYSPIYYEYIDGCVESTYEDVLAGRSNGTMLMRNGNNILYQYSAADGDRLALERVDEINSGKDVLCNQKSFDDSLLFNTMVDAYKENLQRYRQTVAQNAALLTCLKLEEIQANASVPVYSNAIDAVFNYTQVFFEHPPSDSAIYNCSALENCPAIRTNDANSTENLCTGPNPSIIASAAHIAACTTEHWIHANVFGMFMVIATFVLMNISRLFFMRAFVRLSWRHLITGPFAFLGSTTDSGILVYPEVVAEKGITMRTAIAEALRRRIKEWERFSIFLLIMALSINAPWIWGLYFLRDNLEYKA